MDKIPKAIEAVFPANKPINIFELNTLIRENPHLSIETNIGKEESVMVSDKAITWPEWRRHLSKLGIW